MTTRTFTIAGRPTAQFLSEATMLELVPAVCAVCLS
jgi:hypothetical protein